MKAQQPNISYAMTILSVPSKHNTKYTLCIEHPCVSLHSRRNSQCSWIYAHGYQSICSYSVLKSQSFQYPYRPGLPSLSASPSQGPSFDIHRGLMNGLMNPVLQGTQCSHKHSTLKQLHNRQHPPLYSSSGLLWRCNHLKNLITNPFFATVLLPQASTQWTQIRSGIGPSSFVQQIRGEDFHSMGRFSFGGRASQIQSLATRDDSHQIYKW